MKITRHGRTYVATFKHRSGEILMGFAGSWSAAALCCLELVSFRDAAAK
tara:strand:- start:11 stop:157 length:147 start_codon:yes stop_codon:yes gene_type:complete